MNRKEKIQLLNAIKEGKISIEQLQPPRLYLFYERSDRPGIYTMDGKEYNQKEYLDFCDIIKSKNRDSIIWKENKHSSNEDKIITFQTAKGCEPLHLNEA